jgi:hypothetical protein
MIRSLTRLAPGATLLALLTVNLSGLRAEEVYLVRDVGQLTITEGELPREPQDRGTRFIPGRGDALRQASQPRAMLDGAGEVYLDREDNGGAWVMPLDGLNPSDTLAIRLPEPRDEVAGTLYVPKPGDNAEGMTIVRFKIDGKPGDAAAKAAFERAKARHYRRLLDRDIPGAAWFRHQLRGTGVELRDRNPRFPTRGSTLEETYGLFSGGRAIRENLQLDRPIQERPGANAAPKPEMVPIDGIRGITVAEMDWTARLAGKEPAIDPLAASIPADQHALFIPSLKAASDLLTLYRRWGSIPALQLVASRAQDEGVQAFYERQLGLSLADLSKLADLQTIRGLAATGSDPYLPGGTDLAILFETEKPEPLLDLLRERLSRLEKVEPVAGEVGGVPFFGANRADRRVSAYVASIGNVVVLTNSPAQLERVVATAQGKAESLAKLPEYRFFRDRYARGEGDESAFLVLSDATIRRWCGPKWRIGTSRRLRAAAYLSEIQAANLKSLADETNPSPEGLTPPAGAIDLGELHWVPDGVASSTYGTLEFQTPILELDLDEVTQDEAQAYERWRDGYQRNWRGVFDPIALRISAPGGRLAADVTVMPLILASDYQFLADLVGKASIPPGAGDPHPEALLHAVMALDVKSQTMGGAGDTLNTIADLPGKVGLSWLGPAVAAYVDEDKFWADLATAEDPRAFFAREWPRMPFAVHAEVSDPAKLALFLGAMRAYAERTSPDLLDWTPLKHGERSYVRISARGQNGLLGSETLPLRLYYATTPKGFTVSLNEDVIKRFLDRQGPASGRPKPEPWLGESLALRARRKGLDVLGGAGRDEFRTQRQLQCWGNLPILNEWKRLFPDQDPVAVHERAWGVRLVCPGGGDYVWNDRWRTMESTAYGHPGEPRPGPAEIEPLAGVGAVDFGVSLKDGGLRGKVEVEMRPEP